MTYQTGNNGMQRSSEANVPRRRGFTLTELLVVIVIITLLASITSYVILSARNTAKASVVKMQMAQLSMALDAYKKEYGEYPPDFSDTNAVMRHVQKRWPRYGVTDFVQFRAHIAWGSKLSALVDQYKGNTSFSLNLSEASNFWNFSNNADFMNLDPAPCCYASALVFWLGGLPGANGTPVGFFHNPKAPLGFEKSVGANETQANVQSLWTNIDLRPLQREEQFFAFPEGSVVTKYNIPCFNLDEKPVLYFRAVNEIYSRTGNVINNAGAYALPAVSYAPRNTSPYDKVNVLAKQSTKFYFFPMDTELGVAAPYSRDTEGQWYGQESFQLIHPGRDGSFGTQVKVGYTYLPRAPGAQLNLTMQDNDNITNFLEKGATLESEFK